VSRRYRREDFAIGPTGAVERAGARQHQNEPSASSTEFLADFQVELRRVLNAFVNGYDLNRIGRYALPFAPGRLIRSSGTHETLRTLATRLRVPPSLMQSFAAPRGRRTATILAAMYEFLQSTIDSLRVQPARHVMAARQYDVAVASAGSYTRHVASLAREMISLKERWCDELIIHGSQATADYEKGFSDVDTLLLVSSDAAVSWRSLIALRGAAYPMTRFMYRVDPLQHHGFFACTAIDMHAYPETFLPLSTLALSSSVGAPVSLRVQVRPSDREATGAFVSLCQELRRYFVQHRDFSNLYEFKAFLSFVMLLPAFFFQALGESMDKKASLARFRASFPEHAGVLDTATRLRASFFPDVATGWPAWWPDAAPPPLVQKFGKTLVHRRLVPPVIDLEEFVMASVGVTEALYDRHVESTRG
jgi:hypothetical protein